METDELLVEVLASHFEIAPTILKRGGRWYVNVDKLPYGVFPPCDCCDEPVTELEAGPFDARWEAEEMTHRLMVEAGRMPGSGYFN